ncbi:2-isopropylmalate synthase [Lachnospiraceae bacterium C10]|nr:2-isopropylmalate synthase [Lachnospiraceae bacterium C10]
MMNYQHYRKNPVLSFPERTWPDKEIEKAPIWCSVDLRDGNQALVEPMNVEEKMEMFELLLSLGFKEIEIGFPAASQIEYDFLRKLVAEHKIPDDVKVQVLCQCRQELIDRTFEAIQGIPNIIFHIYNSTSTLQRDVVFQKNEDEIVEIAIAGTRMVKEGLHKYDGNLQLEYSPESFTGTEVEFASRICNAVAKEWDHATKDPIIFNLPATVEMNTPNVYADQVEWMKNHFEDPENVIISVHPHNDRGTGIACAELALLAGADRVEGTLLGNGERTGNVDILTVAYNMFSQGVDPKLEINNIKKIVEMFERCCKMEVNPRHPYAGSLVFTAFSGSHQDAINKGKKALAERGSDIWQVPYLPIDPADIGREYEPVVRINSQSGKGGVAFVMDTVYGYKLPKKMQREFADVIQLISEKEGGEVKPERIMKAFKTTYIDLKDPFELVYVDIDDNTVNDDTHVALDFKYNGELYHSEAEGNGPIDALKTALRQCIPQVDFCVMDYTEHALSGGSHAKAAAYIEIMDPRSENVSFGVGVSSNITRASIRGIFSAINRMIAKEKDYV